MIIQIKRLGGSLIIRLPKNFIDFHGLKENDWIDISEIFKVEKEKQE